MSDTPKTDALFFPYGRDHTAAASPSLLVCMTQYELLERENAVLRLDAERYRWLRDECKDADIAASLGWMGQDVGIDAAIDAAIREEGK